MFPQTGTGKVESVTHRNERKRMSTPMKVIIPLAAIGILSLCIVAQAPVLTKAR